MPGPLCLSGAAAAPAGKGKPQCEEEAQTPSPASRREEQTARDPSPLGSCHGRAHGAGQGAQGQLLEELDLL